MKIFLPTPAGTLKYWVSCLFDFNVGERLLAAWVKALVPVSPTPWFLMRVLRAGLGLVRAHSAYGALWLIHYLNRGSDWATASRLMAANPLCPLGVRDLYRNLLDAEEKDVKETLKVLAFPRSVRRALDRYKGGVR